MGNIGVGTRVIVNNPNLKAYGKIGKVTYVYPRGEFGDKLNLDVKLDDGGSITINESKVEPTFQSLTSYKEDNVKHLAFVHYHNYGNNPESIEEAIDMFSEEELGQPELTVYGTKEEIEKRISQDVDRNSFENCFIIMDGEVYPVETQINVKW